MIGFTALTRADNIMPVAPRLPLVLVLLFTLLALTPLAHASPPDQTWIGGFYDDTDYDDIVLLATGGFHAVQTEPVSVLLPVWEVVAVVPATPRESALEPVHPSETGRAPPSFLSLSV